VTDVSQHSVKNCELLFWNLLTTYYANVCVQIKEEFQAIVPGSKSLMAEWQPVKHKVLALATTRSTTATLVEDIDDADEGNSVQLLSNTL